MVKKGFVIAALSLIGILLWTGCTDPKISSNPDFRLSFSTDTLSFDTVFTTIGSSTAGFMIYNRNSSPLSISSITLANGANTGFRMNVDGTIPTNNSVKDVEIRAHDSLYVFVSVTVNPTLKNNPLLIRDSIVCITNGNMQNVKLRAYGQDVTIFRNKTIHNDSTLTASKPFLIFGYLAVDNGKTLTINPGATLYFHDKAYLKVNGNLKAEGQQGKAITFRGDRLDNLFADVPYNYLSGQWGGIQLLGTQNTYSLNYVVINSGKVGIDIPNGTTTLQPTVTIGNARIHNFDSCGISSRNAILTLYNSEVSNCKSYCLYFLGGSYTLTQNTIANYYNDVYAGKHRDGTPSVILLNADKGGKGSTYPLSGQFVNCVIAGSVANEIAIPDGSASPPSMPLKFEHCYLMNPPIKDVAITNQWGKQKDTLFVRTVIRDKSYYDFRPDSLSQLRKKADATISQKPLYRYDMNGKDRMWQNAPDIGAYQWVSKK